MRIADLLYFYFTFTSRVYDGFLHRSFILFVKNPAAVFGPYGPCYESRSFSLDGEGLKRQAIYAASDQAYLRVTIQDGQIHHW